MMFSELESDQQKAMADKGNDPLDEWYRRVRNIEIEKLPLDDLARAVRQELFAEHVVPIALTVLERDPLAGEDYDGQLIYAISLLPRTTIDGISGASNRLKAIVDRISKNVSISTEIEKTVNDINVYLV